jgi:hypothetical protein
VLLADCCIVIETSTMTMADGIVVAVLLADCCIVIEAMTMASGIVVVVCY